MIHLLRLLAHDLEMVEPAPPGPAIVRVKVLDVVPYRHGVYCSIEDGKPFVNDIVSRDWSEDGEKVIFMLESHNFLFEPYGGELDVVVLESVGRRFFPKDESDFLSKRPKPSKTCESCQGKGKIEIERKPH